MRRLESLRYRKIPGDDLRQARDRGQIESGAQPLPVRVTPLAPDGPVAGWKRRGEDGAFLIAGSQGVPSGLISRIVWVRFPVPLPPYQSKYQPSFNRPGPGPQNPGLTIRSDLGGVVRHIRRTWAIDSQIMFPMNGIARDKGNCKICRASSG